MRAMGKVLFDDTTVSNPIAEEAKKRQRQRQEELRARREARAQRPLLNRDRYPNLYAEWLAGKAKGFRKLPKCPVCREATLHWDEPHHECEGFKPMFPENDQEWHDRMEAQREAIREAKRNGLFFSEDEDDLSGNEDEPEEDESYEDCDGDPMWE
jgi:hypothetical protein